MNRYGSQFDLQMVSGTDGGKMRPSSFHVLQQPSIETGDHISLMRAPAANAMLALLLSFGVAARCAVLPQTLSAVKGIVVATDGQPLRGVEVYGGNWRQVIPVTNGRGG